ncbi:MAG TPA: hypothetical protein VJ806_14590 [Luteimonas sp.]|nr:hypothetical protein [Luteimonas sp.]
MSKDAGFPFSRHNGLDVTSITKVIYSESSTAIYLRFSVLSSIAVHQRRMEAHMPLAHVIHPCCLFAFVALPFSATSGTTYPAAIHGYWEFGHEQCKALGNYDSDGRVEITKTDLINYEQSNKPLRVIQVSKTPKAWKIKSELKNYEEKSIEFEIFALSDENTLTVIGFGTTKRFTRCH